MNDVKSMLPEELEAAMFELGQPKFRAKQIFKWVNSGAESFDEMTDIGKSFREILKSKFFITVPKMLRKQVSREDGTVKYLWQLGDGNTIESVVMKYEHGYTVCVSSQVGCRMGCVFCASTKEGLVRDLRPSEILDQVIFAQKDLNIRISNIVLMGIGEPLDNFDNVLKFLSIVNHKDGLNIGMRHISLSTCGLVEAVDKLGNYNLQLTLSISLHAPDNETRKKLMPIGKVYSVEELIAVCRRYYDKTGRRISFEYALIKDVNDSVRQADMLAALVRPIGGHVNIIPLNDIAESPYKQGNVREFVKLLADRGVNATVRRRLGKDIDAACGQLRRKAAGKN